MALARSASGITEVSVIARVAVRRGIFFPTLALSGGVGAVSGRIKVIAVARLTHVGRVERFVPRPIKPRFTAIAIDALGIMFAILTYTTALVITVNIQRQVFFVHFRIIDALVRVSETIAGFACEFLRCRGLLPLLLLEALATSRALRPASVVLASAD